MEEQNKTRKLPNSPVDLCLRLLNSMVDGYLDIRSPLTRRVEHWQQQLLQGNRRFKQWHQLFHENMAFQQVENLCEEQIETLQEFRDEIVENYHHVIGEKTHSSQDLLLVRLNDLMSHVERIQNILYVYVAPFSRRLICTSQQLPTRPMRICVFLPLLLLYLHRLRF